MSLEGAPPTIHRGEKDLPFVEVEPGNYLRLLQVDLAQGIWIVHNRFEPGLTIQRHKHTGQVYAFTQSGSWHYLESPEAVNSAGSYLFEPAGSVHTLHVPPTNDEITDVQFVIYGANLNLADDDSVQMVIDAHFMLPLYKGFCQGQHGMPDPPVVVLDQPGDPLAS